jgi:hypothetical protein
VRRDLGREHGMEGGKGRLAGGGLVTVELVVRLRERREVDAGQERLVAGPIVDVRGRDARGTERSPVEPATERDDPRPSGDPARPRAPSMTSDLCPGT